MESKPPTRQQDGCSPIEITVKDLHKAFGTNKVLRGIDLTIHRGELVAIVGGSGSGKSVLLEHIIGQMTPDTGSVRVADHESDGSPLVDLATLDEAGMNRLRRHWAVVFQANALLSGTVRENLSLPLEWVKGLSDSDSLPLIRRAIQAVGLDPDEVINKKRHELSGGMAKRVAIARAIALDPLLIFYDEPTTGLDPEHAKLIQDLVFETHEKPQSATARTTIIITHDKDLLYRLQPRIVMIHEGKIFFDGTYPDFEASDSPVIKPYIDLMPVLHRRPIPTLQRHQED